MAAVGVLVLRLTRSDRQDAAGRGNDPVGAVIVARASQSGRARGAPKGRDGAVEAIRALMVAERSARAERTQTINQARSLILTGPEDLRNPVRPARRGRLVAGIALRRPRPGDAAGYATRFALRELGRRAEFLDSQIERLDDRIVPRRIGVAARRRRVPLWDVSPWMQVWRWGLDLDGSRIVASSTPVRISVPDRGPRASVVCPAGGCEERGRGDDGSRRRLRTRSTSRSWSGSLRLTWRRRPGWSAAGCRTRRSRGSGAPGSGRRARRPARSWI